MNYQYPSLEEFILGPHRNHYIKYKHLKSYYHKGPHYIEGKTLNVLTRANTCNTRRLSNIEINPKRKSTGLYRELDNLTAELAVSMGMPVFWWRV